jgi:phage terminase small subunit
MLFSAGLLADEFAEALAMGLCQPWADFVACQQQMDALPNGGHTLVTPNGVNMRHPLSAAKAAAWAQYIKGCASFGMTPSDIQSCTKAAKPTEDDGKAAFFNRGPRQA